jgi:hypothetical protein
MGVADLPGQPAVFKPNKWPISPKYAEILSRFTKMPAEVASNGLKVEPNSIYLIPPGKSMSIQTGMLYLSGTGAASGA